MEIINWVRFSAAALRRRRRRSAIRSDIPPADQASIIWAFDPDLVGAAEDKIGPAHTLATPVRTAGPPGFYTFNATDNITFGDSLDAVWTAAAGFTIHVAINVSAADVAAAQEYILFKDQVPGSLREWDIILVNGVPDFTVFYGGVGGNQDYTDSTAGPLATGKHVLTVTFNPSLPFGTRSTLYLDGVILPQTHNLAGSDGTIADTAAVLTQGFFSFGVNIQGPSVQSYIYGYKRVQSPAEILANYNWIHTVKGW